MRSPGVNGVGYAEKEFNMPEGFQLTIPKGAHYAMFKSQGENQDPNLVYSIVVFLFNPENNVSLILGYATYNGFDNGFVPGDKETTIDSSTFQRLYSPDSGGKPEDLPISDGVTPIARPQSANQILSMSLFANSGSFGSSYSKLSTSLKVRWNYFVDSNQKLIVPCLK
jgi:hypothetical protein